MERGAVEAMGGRAGAHGAGPLQKRDASTKARKDESTKRDIGGSLHGLCRPAWFSCVRSFALACWVSSGCFGSAVWATTSTKGIMA